MYHTYHIHTYIRIQYDNNKKYFTLLDNSYKLHNGLCLDTLHHNAIRLNNAIQYMLSNPMCNLSITDVILYCRDNKKRNDMHEHIL